MTHHIWDNFKMTLAIVMYNVWKMIKAQLKPNFDPTFLLSLKEKLHVKERRDDKDQTFTQLLSFFFFFKTK
jgi:hypothetical protein